MNRVRFPNLLDMRVPHDVMSWSSRIVNQVGESSGLARVKDRQPHYENLIRGAS